MPSAEPLVSALIPARDCERYVGEAIESALAQTHAAIEVVVVDNASCDGTAAVVRGFGDRIRLVHEGKRGIGPARNAAIRAARGVYLAFLDCDDLWQPRKTEAQLAAFASDPPPDIVLGYARQFASPDLDPERAAALRIPKAPQPGLYMGTALVPRRIVDRVGGWRDDVAVSDSLEWFLAARRLGLRELMLPDVVTLRRVHDRNHSLLNRDLRKEWARVLKQQIDERRGS
ncbi:MAG TPA: glycosyltransferase family A protein [Solirubrobacterales bacterium]|nr:glycosyltransferase family A protein [Solirubrobacterales bacterium]